LTHYHIHNSAKMIYFIDLSGRELWRFVEKFPPQLRAMKGLKLGGKTVVRTLLRRQYQNNEAHPVALRFKAPEACTLRIDARPFFFAVLILSRVPGND
jgi:hypothetical protein